MNMNLNFNMPVNLITGRGCITQNASAFGTLGKKALIVTGGNSAKRSGALDDVTAALKSCGVDYLIFDEIRQNPLLSSCVKAGAFARENGIEFLIGIGGGSPLDATKAIAVFAANDIPAEEIYDYSWKNPALPFVLVGTTAGTASELSAFAVITIDRTGRKRSLGCQQTYARYSFGDPRYTDSLPLDFTLSTSMDALSHAIEGYYSNASTTISDLLAIEAVKTLLPVYRALNGVSDAAQITAEQRDGLYYGSLLAGFPLNRCGTCYCHPLGYFLSEDYGIPHGYACAVTLTDFIDRSARLLPEKAAALYSGADTSRDELAQIIAAFMRATLPRLTQAQIDEICARFDAGMGNFVKSPGGYTIEEARMLLTSIYLK